MTMAETVTQSALGLSKAERLALLVELWRSLEPEPALTQAEQRLIEARLKEHRESPNDTIPHEEAQRRRMSGTQ